MAPKRTRDGGSAAQKRPAAPLPGAVCAEKNSSTPIASDTTADKGAANKNIKTFNKNLAKGTQEGVEGGGCDMGLLSGFSLAGLICE